MKGQIDQLLGEPAQFFTLGLDSWMMHEMNQLAKSLGWCESVEAARCIFWHRGGVQVTIFGVSGGSWNGSLVLPEPPDEYKKECGARRRRGKWIYPADSQKLYGYYAECRLQDLRMLLPMLRSWLVKADADLAIEAEKEIPPTNDAWLPATHFVTKYGIPADRLTKARRDGRLKGNKHRKRWRYRERDVRAEWPEDFSPD